MQLLGFDVYERMMQRARALAAETTAGLARDRERIEALAAATPEARGVLEARAIACATARAAWRALKPELDARGVAAADADAAATAATDRVRRLDAIVVPNDVRAVSTAVRDAEALLAAPSRTPKRWPNSS